MNERSRRCRHRQRQRSARRRRVSRLGIEIVPLSIRFGDDEFVDREELSTDEFWARCKASPTLPSTAAPSPGRFEQAYRRLAEDGSRSHRRDHPVGRPVGHVPERRTGRQVGRRRRHRRHASSTAAPCRSGPGRSPSPAPSWRPRCPLTPQSLDTIVATATELVGRTRVFGALDTMDNLKKGGRVGNAKALLATALSIKPIIAVENGVVEQYGRQRTRSKALQVPRRQGRRRVGRRWSTSPCSTPTATTSTSSSPNCVRTTPDEIVVGQIGPGRRRPRRTRHDRRRLPRDRDHRHRPVRRPPRPPRPVATPPPVGRVAPVV